MQATRETSYFTDTLPSVQKHGNGRSWAPMPSSFLEHGLKYESYIKGYKRKLKKKILLSRRGHQFM